MFNYKNLTDFEKLQFTESYIKELKRQLRTQEKSTQIAKDNLENMIEDFKSILPNTTKLLSYKKDMQASIFKKNQAEHKNNKLEHKNFLLREKIRELKTELYEKEEA